MAAQVADLEAESAAMVDLLRDLEELKNAAAAAQMAAAGRLDAAQRRVQAAAGEPAARQGRGVAQQVGLARRVSPFRARSLLGLAKLMPTEMPHAWAAFRQGWVTEWGVTLLARETACLSVEHRLQVDRELAADADRFEAMSERQIQGAAARLAARLDPASVVRRRRKAESERYVSIRPAPDTMSRLTLLVPMAQGVAAFAALKRAADELVSAGDERGRGQIMADVGVERLTGQAVADRVPVRLNLVMTDRSLFGGDDQPAALVERGVGRLDLPAGLARELAAKSLDAHVDGKAVTWLRRLYVSPTSGQLLAMDSRSREVPAGIADFVTLRDRICRTPWCDAPVRHIDHVVPHAEGGETSADGAQGLCEDCNHAKQAPGWRQWVQRRRDGTNVVETVTPTGHRHRATSEPMVPRGPTVIRIDLQRPA